MCPGVPLFEPCEISFELSAEEAQAHPNPYVSVQLKAEFRSPDGGRTKVMPGFWDGGSTFRLRYSPDYEGRWDFRIISNLPSVDKKIFEFQASPARTKGFIEVFNTRFFRYTTPNTAHYWMGDTLYSFATIPWETFKSLVDIRADQKFNHLRGLVLGSDETAKAVLADPDRPVVEHFREVDRRVDYMNQKGLTYDLILGGDRNQLDELLPRRRQRERYVRYLVARYSAFNITWQGVQEFEEYENGRELLTELNKYIAEMDPYKHPRSTHTIATSSTLADDGWMTYIVQQSSAPSLAALDYELNGLPIVNTEFGYEDSGAGKSHPHHVDSDEFRKRLWRAAMRGQYPTFGNTGTYGGRKLSNVDARFADSPGARYMGILYDFFTQTRYFDIQTYYRVEGGPALSMHYTGYDGETSVGVEFMVYVEDGGAVDLILPKNGYDLSWFNPIDGTWLDDKKKFKGERFRSPGPPDPSHDWVLYIRRDGKKERMNKSFFLEARGVKMKEVEARAAETPFAIQFPDGNELVAGQEYEFSATLTKSTAAAKRMLYVWLAEASGSDQAARVLGTTQFGRWKLPESLADRYPGTLQIRLLGVDGAGNLFESFRAFSFVKE